jgi:probable F420-dependent oxidoreductase
MASMPVLDGRVDQWRISVRLLEELGFSSVAVSDHLTGGWSMDPLISMTVAAEATTHLRVASVVLLTGPRHPALVQRAIANLDVFSEGRVEFGIGAGWLAADYEAVGMPFEPAADRVARLSEAIEVIKALFAGGSVTYTGRYYQISELPGVPAPTQHPHPPLLVGGGSRHVLELAGRDANIVGINVRLRDASKRTRAVADQTDGRLQQKVSWARAGAASVGRDPDDLELHLAMLDVRVRAGGDEHRWTSSHALCATSDLLAASPVVLHGTVEECVDKLMAIRERYGVSYVHLGGNLEAAAPLVARLAGT